MEMKKLLSCMVMLLVLSSTVCLASGQRHRHHSQTIGLTQQKDTLQSVAAIDNLASDTAGIDVFSDTTTTAATTGQAKDNEEDDEDYYFNIASRWMDIPPIFGILFVAAICLAPFILLGFIVWIIYRNRNQRYRLAEKAMEQGKPIPEDLLTVKEISDDQLWRKAIRNIFVGIGLAIFFACWHSHFLSGLGWLLCFYGIGQAVICKTTGRNNKSDRSDRTDRSDRIE